MKVSVQLVVSLLFAVSVGWTIPPVEAPDSVEMGVPFALSFVVPRDRRFDYALDTTTRWQGFTQIHGVEELHSDSTLEFHFSVSAYRAPLCTLSLPSLSVTPRDTSDTTLAARIDTLGPVVVRTPSVLPDSLDTLFSQGLHAPLNAGRFPWLFVVLLLIGVTLLGAIAYALYRKLNGTKLREVVVPVVSPYEEATLALMNLKAREYLARGENKAFVFELSELLKRYLGREYGGNIQESTATEFLSWLGSSSLATEHRVVLEQFIVFGEPIKFADLPASPTELLLQLDKITALITATHVEIEEARRLAEEVKKKALKESGTTPSKEKE